MGKKKYLTNLLILAILCLVPVFLKGNTYAILVLCMSLIYIISVSGLDILFGYTGQISIGQAAFYAIGAYTSTILSMKTGIPVWITMILGAVMATILGVIIAFSAAKLVHHFLALLTIAFGQITYIVISHFENLTNGFSGITGIPSPSIGSFVFKSNLSYFYLFLALAIIFLVIKQRIIKSRVGRAFIAIRENTHAANGIGINVKYYKIMSFAVSAFFTGFAGTMYAHFVKYISPDSFMLNQSVLILTMLLFGGTGNLAGPILGATLLMIVSEYVQMLGDYQALVYGGFLLLVVIFLPKGVFGIIGIIKTNFKRLVSSGAEVK